MMNGPAITKSLVLLPASLVGFYPGQVLKLACNPLPRITEFDDGMPHAEWIMGVPTKGPNGGEIDHVWSDIKATFRGTFMPGCCGLGLIYKFRGTELRPEVWDALFNEVLWVNCYQIQTWRPKIVAEGEHATGGDNLTPVMEQITTHVNDMTNNYWGMRALSSRLWYHKSYKGARKAA